MHIEDLIPINGRIVIEVLKDDSVYNGVIVRLDAGQEKSNLGIVKAIDTGYNGEAPLRIEVGDTVMFNKHSGSVIKLDRFEDKSPEYRVIKQDDVFGIIKCQC